MSRFFEVERKSSMEKVGLENFDLECFECEEYFPLIERIRYPHITASAWACIKCHTTILERYLESVQLNPMVCQFYADEIGKEHGWRPRPDRI